jgi:hypothetical protein
MLRKTTKKTCSVANNPFKIAAGYMLLEYPVGGSVTSTPIMLSLGEGDIFDFVLNLTVQGLVCIRGGPISLWLYEEKNKLRD